MNIAELVYLGNFKKASEIAINMSIDEIYRSLSEKAHQEGDIVFYGFFVHLLLSRSKDELAELHHSASVLLSFDLRTIQGAYDLAEYHIIEALERDPENEDYQRYLKHLQSVPR